MACLFSLKSNAEIDLTTQAGGPILLLSSKAIADLGPNNSTETLCHKKALTLCDALGQTLFSFEIKKFEETEILSMISQKSYLAYTASTKNQNEGLIFNQNSFPLTEFQQTDFAGRLEKGFYGSALLSSISGGISTYLVYLGIDGPGNPEAALIFGCTTVGVTVLCAAAGGAIRLYKKIFPRHNAEQDEEVGTTVSKSLPAYALPVLASKIICL